MESNVGGLDFFITYARPDEEWAEWVAATLEDAGYSTILQAWDFRPGDNFIAKMDAALRAKHTVGLLSSDYLGSLFTQAEWTAAYRQTLVGKERGFIPLRVALCDPSPLLGPVAYIDLVDIDQHQARDRLLRGVADAPPRRPRRPEFPGTTR